MYRTATKYPLDEQHGSHQNPCSLINVREKEGGYQELTIQRTGNVGYTRHRMKTQTNKKHNTICSGHHHTQHEDKQSDTTEYVLDTTIHKQTQIT